MEFVRKWFTLFASTILIFSLLGCGNDDVTGTEMNDQNESGNEVVEEELITDQFTLLQEAADEYLQNANFETITARELYEWTIFGGEEDYVIVDVRPAEVFAKGHIDGAINIPYGYIHQFEKLELLPKDKKIVVTCFAGNQANHAAALWGMLGYETITLENGMGGWTKNTDLAPAVPTKTFDFELTTEKLDFNETYNLPSLQYENVKSLEDLLKRASIEYKESEKSLIMPAPELKEKIKNNDESIFVLDIRSREDYEKGHVPNAYNIPVNELAKKENLEKLPTDKQIVLVGYNSYEANQANRILNLLGYDSIAMAQGMRIWHSDSMLTGITPISDEKLEDLPVRELNYDLDGEDAEVGCS